MPLDSAGNTLASAKNLNITSNKQVLTDWVGSSDIFDYYSININSRSSINISLDGLSADANLELIKDANSNGIVDNNEIIKGSYGTDTKNELISVTLDAGKYYIRAYSAKGDTSYNLSFSSQTVNISPTSLQFSLSQNNLTIKDTLSISNASVIDENGGSDISKIDFKIKKSDGSFVDVTDTTSFTVSGNKASFNYSLNFGSLNLASGNYSLWGVAFDKAGLTSNIVERSFTFTRNIAPNTLSFGLNNNNLKLTDTLSISNASVIDENGGSDISKIDFKIKKSDGSFVDVTDTTSFNVSGNKASFNYSLNFGSLNLASGNYSLWGVAFDKAGVTSNIVERSFTFTRNLAPNTLSFGLNNNNLKLTDTLSISNASVIDENGGSDISKIDFKIKKSDGSFVDVADTTSFNISGNKASFNYSLNFGSLNLASGNYSLWGVAFDKAGVTSNIVERSFTFTRNLAPNTLSFGLNNNNLKLTDTLSISNASVIDENGGSDISKIDFKIKKSDGSFVDVADTTSFNISGNKASFNYSLNFGSLNLASGNYSLWGVAFDKAGVTSNIVERSFTFTRNLAPNTLSFGLNNNNLKLTDTLSITNASVIDENGGSDISKIDFKIKKSDGSFVDVADTTSFTVSGNKASFNYSLNFASLNLASGNYSLWGVAFDKAGVTSNIVERSFSYTANSAPNSLSFNINNTSLKSTDTLNINTGSVIDVNGANDISKIDLKIKKADGSFIEIDDINTFSLSDNSAYFSHNLNLGSLNLISGNYKLWGVAYDKAGKSSNIWESSFTITSTPTIISDPKLKFASNSNNSGIEGILYSGRAYWDTSQNGGVVTYSFYNNNSGKYYGNEHVSEVNNSIKTNVKQILQSIESFINIRFVEVEDTANKYGVIRYMFSDGVSEEGFKPNDFYAYAYLPSFDSLGGDVHLNPNYESSSGNKFSSAPGNHGYMSLIHETLHALGLKHPGDYDGQAFADDVFLSGAEDNVTNTVMTYNFAGNAAGTAMPYDIRALQYLYGAKNNNFTNTNYSFNSVYGYSVDNQIFGSTTNRLKQTIWDSGGVDTLDFSQLSKLSNDGYRFDLREGGLLTIQSAYNKESYKATDKVTYKTSSFGTAIAYGSKIENIINSQGNDYIIGNSSSNTFKGYKLGTNTGDDILELTDSSDILELSSYSLSNLNASIQNSDLVLKLGTDGSVTIKNYFSNNTSNSNSSMKILVGNQYYIYNASGLSQSIAAPAINTPTLPVNESSNLIISSLSQARENLAVLKDNPVIHNQQQAQRCNCQACSNNRGEIREINMIGSSNLFSTLSIK